MTKRRHKLTTLLGMFALCFVLIACGGNAEALAAPNSSSLGSTSGAKFKPVSKVVSLEYDAGAASSENNSSIDISHVSQGVVHASGTSSSRLKLLVTHGNMSYNYDIPGDGTPISCPVNMGNGSYTFAVMRNTGGNSYVELHSVSADVKLDSEFEPFLHANVFCNYTEKSKCVAKARSLTKKAKNQGDALAAVCTYVVENIKYDKKKASKLSGKSGYVPNPDETLSSGKGICFDYASLSAAMLRSIGLPARVMTGYVSPGDLYHSWTMVYIDGSWKTVQFSVNPKKWTRMDLTFAAGSGSKKTVGDGNTYTDRYMY